MLDSKATQFQLSADGNILWQEKQGSPLPGVPVAKLVKGDHILRPAIDILDVPQTKNADAQALKDGMALWLHAHMMAVMEPLMMLGIGGAAGDGVIAEIVGKVYDGLGTVPRERIEDLIGRLDTEQRAALRQKKIRLGPVLVFMPLLNKPAAVRLRALLWCLYYDLPLPAAVPADGIVSVAIGDENADCEYYRTIGYPLYGGRAVRIDMLDRVINAVYDHAQHGKFQARHEMAEWLGCSIADLYAILEAMGHRKIHDPADEKTEEAATETPPVTEEPVPAEGSAEAETAKPVETKPPESKPELATFLLKRGKAFEKGGKASREGKKYGDNKPPYQKDFKNRKSKPGKKFEKDGKKDFKKDLKKDAKKDRGPRVISIEAQKKEEDSPFAILQQLKTKADG